MLVVNVLLALIGAAMVIVAEGAATRVAGVALAIIGTAQVWLILSRRRKAQ
ncbi:hypothetical protein [Cellulomonas sp. SLBN-39]|uniref:hypothetical protein n=1 Tax=Cellulomonas sp. SLBN-39 TaxID=2768446 RepID=UPI00116A3ACA|nr:hypothetical protein [Cellulomonas sp. SLBN-39]TQL02328.1 hypothetical protein FBY24_1402 [Cellulomonas sp. SLBN-39]